MLPEARDYACGRLHRHWMCSKPTGQELKGEDIEQRGGGLGGEGGVLGEGGGEGEEEGGRHGGGEE